MVMSDDTVRKHTEANEQNLEVYPNIRGKTVRTIPILDLNREELLACYVALRKEEPYKWHDSAMEKINTYLVKTEKG
jgi:hypothetical protein